MRSLRQVRDRRRVATAQRREAAFRATRTEISTRIHAFNEAASMRHETAGPTVDTTLRVDADRD